MVQLIILQLTRTITVHSHKGGNGKTSIAVNLATHLVSEGNRVCLLDMDFSAPSLQTYAPNRKEYKLNELFIKNTDIDDILFDASYLISNPRSGKLYMGLADESGSAISKFGHRDNNNQLDDLYILINIIKNTFSKPPWEFDFVIIDTSPGLSQSAINAVAIAEELFVILKLSNSDVDGVFQFLEIIHKALKPNTHLIVNHIPHQFMDDFISRDKIFDLLKSRIINKISKTSINFAGVIEYDEEVIKVELDYAFNKVDKEVLPRPIMKNILPESNFVRSLLNLNFDFLEGR